MALCMKAHVSKKLAADYKTQIGQSTAQKAISDVYLAIGGGFLGLMLILLLLTCWYHNSYKRWAARERIIYKAEHAETKVSTSVMAPGQQTQMVTIN